MVASSINNLRAHDALARVRALVGEHGTPEQAERLDRIMGGVPAPSRSPIEHAAYQSEAIGILFELVGELIEANRPKPRGRTRKDDKAA